MESTRYRTQSRIFVNNDTPNWTDVNTEIIVGIVLWILLPVYLGLVFFCVHLARHKKEKEKLFSGPSLRKSIAYWTWLRVRMKFVVEKLTGRWIDNIRALLDAVVMVIYTMNTFTRDIERARGIILSISGIFLSVDLIFRVALLPLSRSYSWWLFSFHTGCQMLSLPGTLMSGFGLASFLNLSFLRAVPLYFDVIIALYGSLSKDPRLLYESSRVRADVIHVYVISWAAYLSCLTTAFAGIMVSLELLGNPPYITGSYMPTVDGWNFLTSIEFTVVTLTTVGYGNLTPTTYPGVVFMSLTIIWGIFYLAYRFSLLAAKISQFRDGGGSFRADFFSSLGIGHIVIFGEFRAQDVLTFIETFYSFQKNANTRVVFMASEFKLTTKEREELLSHPAAGKMKFLRGVPMDRHHRQRTSLSQARACIIMSPISGMDLKRIDKMNILRTIGARADAPQVPVFTMHRTSAARSMLQRSLLSPGERGRNKPSRNGDSVCFDRIMARLVALSLKMPGFISMVTNLFMDIPIVPHPEEFWQYEYESGRKALIHLLDFKKSAIGTRLNDVRFHLLENFNIMTISYMDREARKMKMANELHFEEVGEDFSLFVLASDEEITRLLDEYDLVELPDGSRTYARRAPKYPSDDLGLEGENEALIRSKSLRSPMLAGTSGGVLARLQSTLGYSNHMVIIAFSQQSLLLVNEILSSVASFAVSDIILILAGANDELINEYREQRGVLVLDEHPYRLRTLQMANMRMAKQVIVLLDEDDSMVQDVGDSKSIFTMLLIQSILESLPNQEKPQLLALSNSLKVDAHSSVETLLMVAADENRYSTEIFEHKLSDDELFQRGYSTANSSVRSHMPLPKSRKKTRRSTASYQTSSLMEHVESVATHAAQIMAGSLVHTSMLSAVLAREITAPGTLAVFKMLLACDSNPHGSVQSIQLSERWHHQTWLKLSLTIQRNSSIPLALYRNGSNFTCSHHLSDDGDGDDCGGDRLQVYTSSQWVYTKPARCTLLAKDDSVFVFTADVSKLENVLMSSIMLSRSLNDLPSADDPILEDDYISAHSI